MPIVKNYIPNDPSFGSQYYLNSGNDIDINAPTAWDISQGNPAISVAVIDDGVENHLDLRDANGNSRVLQGFRRPQDNSWQVGGQPMPDANLPSTTTNGSYKVGHGVSVAGIIAASTNNGIGVAGIAPLVHILPINLFFDWNYGIDQFGQTFVNFGVEVLDITAAIHLAREQNADVINMSLGGGWNNQAQFDGIVDAINLAKQSGAVVVSAAGNSNQSIGGFLPAGANNHIVVGSINTNGSRASYSNYGTQMDLVGVSDIANNLTTLDREGTFTNAENAAGTERGYAVGGVNNGFGGTSAAAPQVAGVAALMLSVNPNLTPDQVETIMKQQAKTLGLAAIYQGSGLVRACESVFEAMFLNLSITGQNIPSYGANIYLNGLRGVTESTTTWAIIDGAFKINGATSGTSYSPTLVPNNGATGNLTIRFTVKACNDTKERSIDKVLTISTTTGNSLCQNLANKCYKIKPANNITNVLNLEVAGGGTVGGESIWQNYANNCGNQVYRVEQSDESQYCKITAQYAGGRSWQMSAAGGVNDVTIGAEIKNIDYNGNDSQKFFFSAATGGAYHLSTKAVIDVFGGTNSQYHYVDVYGGNNNQFNKLSLWYRNGGDNQRFVFEETGCATSCSGNGGSGGGGNTCGMSIASVGYNCNSNILEAVTVNGDGGAELQYRADAGPWYDYHFHIQFLSPGTHTFSVRKKYDTNCQATITSSICSSGGGGGGSGGACPAAGCLSIGMIGYNCNNGVLETVTVSGGSGNYQYALDNCNVWKDYQFHIQQIPNGNHTIFVRDVANTNCGDAKSMTVGCNNVRQRSNEEAISVIANAEENISGMEIFPNPATDEISIRFLIEKDQKAEISLMDITGKVFQKREIQGTGTAQNEKFTIKNLSAGQYFINLKTDKLNTAKKFLKE